MLLSMVQTTGQLAHRRCDIQLLSVVLTSCLKSMESWEVQVAVSDLSGDVGDKEIGRPTYLYSTPGSILLALQYIKLTTKD